ncbi:TetR/AcrR family transcriptional regulator [bacterium]|nr:TetR/AcrR family transcriptional regulator [bacterium]
MATGKTEKRFKRKNEILEASLFTFARNGYNATGIADIADRVGIGKSTVYEYFDTKADLFIETFRWFVMKSKAIMEEENKKRKSKSMKKQIAKLIDQKIVMTGKKNIKANANLFHLIMEFKSSETSEEITKKLFAVLTDAHEEFKGGIVSMLKEGIKNGEFKRNLNIKIVSEIIFSATMGMNMQTNLNDKFNRDAVSKEFLKILFAGISNTKGNKKK